MLLLYLNKEKEKIANEAVKNNSIIIGPIKDGKRTLDISFDYSNIVNGDIATHRILHQAIQHLVTGPCGLNSIDYVPNPLQLLAKR